MGCAIVMFSGSQLLEGSVASVAIHFYHAILPLRLATRVTSLSLLELLVDGGTLRHQIKLAMNSHRKSSWLEEMEGGVGI